MKMQYINRMPDSPIDITFMVPCRNEEASVGNVLEMIIELSREKKFTFDALVFDDASTDNSREVVRTKQKKYPAENITLIENDFPRGLARNYVDGSYLGQGKYYMCMMGDDPHPKESIGGILDLMGTADIIVPIFGPNDNRGFVRTRLSRLFTILVNWCGGFRVGYYNGVALHKRFNVMRWHSDTDGFAYQAEIIVRLLQEGCTYRESIVINNDRAFGESSALSLRNFASVGHGLLQIFFRRIRHALFYPSVKRSTQFIPLRGEETLGD